MATSNGGLNNGVLELVTGVACVFSQSWLDSEFKADRRQGVLDQEIDKISLLLMMALAEGELLSCALQITPGRRGPGPALPRTGAERRPMYICDIIDRLQSALPEDRRLFGISQFGGIRLFEPLLNQTDLDRARATAVSSGRTKQSEFLDATGILISKFSPRQSIAFGRHLKAVETKKSIAFLEREFDREFRLFAEAAADGSPDIEAVKHLVEACEISDVAYEKLNHDPALYGEARLQVIRSKDSEAKQSILNCRPSQEDIWRDPIVADLLHSVNAMHLFTTALRAAISIRQGGDDSSGGGRKEADVHLQTALAALRSDVSTQHLDLPIDELKDGNLRDAVSPLSVALRQLVTLKDGGQHVGRSS